MIYIRLTQCCLIMGKNALDVDGMYIGVGTNKMRGKKFYSVVRVVLKLREYL